MSTPGQKPRTVLTTVILFGTIAAVSVALAVTTDINIIVRGVIALVAGLAAAGVTSALLSRKRGGAER